RNRKAGRIGGLISGRKAVESGRMARLQSLPQTKEARRQNGRKAVESGRWACMMALPQTQEAQRNSGRKATESGQLASICSKAGRIGGRIGGRKATESGQLVKGNHTRCHI